MKRRGYLDTLKPHYIPPKIQEMINEAVAISIKKREAEEAAADEKKRSEQIEMSREGRDNSKTISKSKVAA